MNKNRRELYEKLTDFIYIFRDKDWRFNIEPENLTLKINIGARYLSEDDIRELLIKSDSKNLTLKINVGTSGLLHLFVFVPRGSMTE